MHHLAVMLLLVLLPHTSATGGFSYAAKERPDVVAQNAGLYYGADDAFCPSQLHWIIQIDTDVTNFRAISKWRRSRTVCVLSYITP